MREYYPPTRMAEILKDWQYQVLARKKEQSELSNLASGG